VGSRRANNLCGLRARVPMIREPLELANREHPTLAPRAIHRHCRLEHSMVMLPRWEFQMGWQTMWEMCRTIAERRSACWRGNFSPSCSNAMNPPAAVDCTRGTPIWGKDQLIRFVARPSSFSTWLCCETSSVAPNRVSPAILHRTPWAAPSSSDGQGRRSVGSRRFVD
jgi:hypothetical protein